MPAATLIQILSIVGSALVAVKLLKTGLFRKYPVFFLYLLFRIPDNTVPLLLDVNLNSYFIFWICTEPVAWVLYVFLALELSTLVFKRHKGVSTFGRWAMYAGIASSVAISLATMFLNNPHGIQGSTMAWYLGAERGVTFGLAVFLLVLLTFLSRYPVPMSRNLLGHLAIYTVYFFSVFLVFLLRSVFGVKMNPQANLWVSAVATLCLVCWFFLFTRKGEEVRANLPTFGAEYEKRALLQLEALNTTLLRAARK